MSTWKSLTKTKGCSFVSSGHTLGMAGLNKNSEAQVCIFITSSVSAYQTKDSEDPAGSGHRYCLHSQDMGNAHLIFFLHSSNNRNNLCIFRCTEVPGLVESLSVPDNWLIWGQNEEILATIWSHKLSQQLAFGSPLGSLRLTGEISVSPAGYVPRFQCR